MPSLDQLEGALAELRKEYPKAEVTVVVDATFAHRIAPSELRRFEDALAKGKYISPPAGAIGRGDAFVLKIAEKSKAIVLSNDSFQEFHGEHSWLFDSDRLLGASPVPGVGWIFILRTPVRGAKSRASVLGVRNLPPMPKPKTPPPSRVKRAAPAAGRVEKKDKDEVRAESMERPHRRVATSVAAVNDPTTFITFIAAHPLGEVIEAEVESFTSHGAIIRYQNVQCYAPLSGLGTPAPRSPREILERGEIRKFVIRGLDSQRRGIELALPEAVVQGVEVAPARQGAEDNARRKPSRVTKMAAVTSDGAKPVEPSAKKAPAKKAAAKRVATKTRTDAKSESANPPAKSLTKGTVPTKSASPKKAPQKTTAARPVSGVKRVAKRAVAKKAVERRPDAKKAVGKSPGAKKSASRVVGARKRGSL